MINKYTNFIFLHAQMLEKALNISSGFHVSSTYSPDAKEILD